MRQCHRHLAKKDSSVIWFWFTILHDQDRDETRKRYQNRFVSTRREFIDDFPKLLGRIFLWFAACVKSHVLSNWREIQELRELFAFLHENTFFALGAVVNNGKVWITIYNKYSDEDIFRCRKDERWIFAENWNSLILCCRKKTVSKQIRFSKCREKLWKSKINWKKSKKNWGKMRKKQKKLFLHQFEYRKIKKHEKNW